MPLSNPKKLLDKFKEEKQRGTWDMIKPHIKRGAVFRICHELDMLGVAMAIALDHASQVDSWLQGKKLVKMSLEDGKKWEKNPHKEIGEFLIIQPYIIFKDL